MSKIYNKENGNTYLIDGILQNTTTSIYDVLSSKDDFREFYDMCALLGIFVNNPTSSTVAPGRKVKFLNQYHYTVYVPTNEAIREAQAKGWIPTVGQIENEGDQSVRDSLENVMERFVRYHFQDNSVFIKGEKVENKAYLTSTINEASNKFYPVYVTNKDGNITLVDEADYGTGRVSARVVKTEGVYNLMTRDMTLNSGDKEKATTIEAYTYAVIHQIDDVLWFEQPKGENVKTKMTLKKRTMKRYLLLMAFLCAVWRAGAQVMVSGRVVDANDGLELMGCTVAEKDATNRVVGGMTTDMNGNFAFKVKNVNNKLVFTFMGYKTQEFPIGSQRKFNVKMEDNTMKVSEVVVKAQKRGPDGAFNIPQREVSMAMTTFKMDAMEGVSVAGADDALQGRVAGLDIVVGGSPGSGSQMRIRGTTSITGNSQPLVVVNGVPYSGEIDESFDFGTANEEEYADLLSVNVEDIEEITVLKDAASTAMWGSKGANGVLLIKTKRGTRGKTRVSYT